MAIELTDAEVDKYSVELASKIPPGKYKWLYPIPRGGYQIAIRLSNILKIPITLYYTGEEHTLIVDDLVDSGKTIAQYHGDKAVVFVKNNNDNFVDYYVRKSDDWIKFPDERQNDIEDSVIRILEYLGEDAGREGLKRTPERYIKFLSDFTKKREFALTCFDSEKYDEMIIQKDIPFYSLCEHHLLPFIGVGTIAYIPKDKIVGLSKLARVLDRFAHGLQNQERLTQQVADYLFDELRPVGVAVTLKARHLCMEMRGIQKHDVYTITSCLKGCFMDNEKCRNEFLLNCGK